jgi:hypothetical protein
MEEKVKLWLDDLKNVLVVQKNLENFEILYENENLFYYYSKIQKILLEKAEEIKKEFEKKLFTIISYEKFIKYNVKGDKFILSPLTLYFWDKEDKNKIKIALFLSNFLNFMTENKKENLKIFFQILNIINKYNPWEKITFWVDKIKYEIFSKEVYWEWRWFYIIEDNIVDRFKNWVFLLKHPSRNIKILKEKIPWLEKTKTFIVFYTNFKTVLWNLEKINFTKINEAEKNIYKPFLALWFYNQYKYVKTQWWLPDDFFEENILINYKKEDFINLFEKYFIPFVVANNDNLKGLKELALFIK